MMNSHTRPNRDAQRSQPETVAWKPAVDIVEYSDRFELLADLPGVTPEDIEIDLHDNTLSIAGRRCIDGNAAERGHAERHSGYFCRRFTLPGSVDADAIAARSEHGALQVRIPKAPEVRPRRIDIAA